jgi:hypothetical protein
MDTKWFFCWISAVFALMFLAVGLREYGQSKCKASYMFSSRSADEIIKICKS